MDLFIVRHGIAVTLGTEGVERDKDRMLSERGLIRTEAAARGLRSLQCRPRKIFTSPLVRARETAEILSRVLEENPVIEIVEGLAPGEDIKHVQRWLTQVKVTSAAVVGHMPDLAELASSLVSEESTVNLMFKKAAACHLTFEGRAHAGQGCLEWLIQPRALRLLAEVSSQNPSGSPSRPYPEP